ncbi:MAG: LUD domain-containing protein [Dehalococcoidia bacterium]
MTVDHKLLDKFKTEATLGGAQVFLAASAEDAVNYVLKLVKDKDIKIVVKSNSSLADKLGLPERLAAGGVRVIETAVAHWAVQLAKGKEVPIDTLAEMISTAAGEKVPAESAALLLAARRVLKDVYAGAGLGITEADFGIAETGTPVTLENEGNARLAAILPKLHLTLLDGNHIAGNRADAAELIKGSSGGIPGHRVPSFIAYLTRRNTTPDIQGESFTRARGPAEEHILIINKL